MRLPSSAARPHPACSTVTLDQLAQTIRFQLDTLVVDPLVQFWLNVDQGDRFVLCGILATTAILAFLIGRRSAPDLRRRRACRVQNKGEALVSRVIGSHFGPPDYHLMNHLTLRMEDGTTQIDHVLLSRFGVFVIETKHYNGWIFAKPEARRWTQVWFRSRFRFQNPIFQNKRHVRAVQGVLDFLPPESVKSVVVFSGNAEFKTEVPGGVLRVDELPGYLRMHTDEIISWKRLRFCVGCLETARLAISAETDVEHVESLARRHGGSAA